jgi:ribonuclease HII
MTIQRCNNVPERFLNNVPERFLVIAGVDEAGRGPLAGPVVAGAVILPADVAALAPLPFPLDSKLFSPSRREELFSSVTSVALAWASARVEAQVVDEINILQATLLAMRHAVEALSPPPDLALVDGNRLPPGLPCPGRTLVRGDRLSLAIGAASIVAKVVRDRIMQGYHEQYPQYGFNRHRGYGTRAHLAALREHGPCPIHRRSFKGVICQIP